MVKTQVQIPDELFHRAKQLAAQQEWSFAEVVRRGLEKVTELYPPDRATTRTWELPIAKDMGQPQLPEAQWFEAVYGTDRL